MNLVPFAGSAAPRPGAQAARLPDGSHPSRPPAGARAERLAGAPRPASRFLAHVLDAARHDDQPPSRAGAVSARAEAHADGPEKASARAREEDPVESGTVVATTEPAAAAPPWVVLALGLAAPGQPGDLANSSSAEGHGEDVGHGAGTDGSPITDAMGARSGAQPGAGELDGPDGAVSEAVAGDASLSLEPEAGVPAAQDTAARSTGRVTPPAQSAELLARWRAATRASGGEVSTGAMPALLGHAAEGGGGGRGAEGADGAASRGMAIGATGFSEDGSARAGRASDMLLRAAMNDTHGAAAGGEGAPPPQPASLLSASGGASADVRSATPTAPVPPAAVADAVVQQIVSSIKMQWKDGIGEAKLQLRPDALGGVTVSLRVEHGAVTAVVRAESAQVQEWVLQHQASLRQQMEDAGLRLEELVVSPDEERQQQQSGHEPDTQRRRPRPPRAGSGALDSPRFELLI